MSRSRYWQHGEMHFAYNVEPTFECPVGKALSFSPDDPPTSRVEQAAAALKMDPHRLAVLLRRSSCGGREIVNDRPSDRCACHGTKMERRGFAVFVDESKPEAEWTSTDRTTVALNRRLSDPNFVPRRVVEQAWCRTKKEARQWAYGKFVEARDAAKAAA